VGVQFAQNAQSLYIEEPRQGFEGLEIDEDGCWGSGGAAVRENGAATVRVSGTILLVSLESEPRVVGRIIAHDLTISKFNQGPAMCREGNDQD
jgi:hypothetical protein